MGFWKEVREFAHYSGWDESGVTHEAVRTGRQSSGSRRGTTVRSTGLPANQCCRCGKKRGLSSTGGVKHCRNDRACIQKASRVVMGEA
ncbi:MAG TPA: hypothetical protein VFG87_23875 [Amycolatopsis sp.]|nr:hypothetical protein [Amycolatopsis sp.]